MHRPRSTLLRLRCARSRLLWFFFGAAAASFWTKRREARSGHGPWSHYCIRSSIQLPAVPCTPDSSFSWIPRDIPKAINYIPTEPRGQLDQWNEEKEFISAFVRQAADKITAMSETAVDKILCSVLILKAKLARHRAEREKESEEQKESFVP